MIEEQQGPPRSDHDGDRYLYDYFKYLTSIGLLSMGALFIFLGMETAKGVPDLLKAAAAVGHHPSTCTSRLGPPRCAELASASNSPFVPPVDRWKLQQTQGDV